MYCCSAYVHIIQVQPNTLFFGKILKKKLLNVFSIFLFYLKVQSSGFSAGNVVAYIVAHSAVLLKTNVANIVLFKFGEQKFVQHGPITIAIGCNGLSLLIFEEKCPNYASGPKSSQNSDSFWVRRLFNVCKRVFCGPNETILLVYIHAKI